MRDSVTKDWSFLIGKYYNGVVGKRAWLIIDVDPIPDRIYYTHHVLILTPNGTLETTSVDEHWLVRLEELIESQQGSL